jgi:P27 family predicted phage terminase small subunit
MKDYPGKSGPKRRILRVVSGDLPKMPKTLTPEAKREWRRIVRHAGRLGFGPMDAALLSTYCEAWSSWTAARRVLDLQGATYTGPNGAVCRRPEVLIGEKAQAHMLKCSDALGFSPAARTRIQVDDSAQTEAERLEEAYCLGIVDRPARRPPRRRRRRKQVEDVETKDDLPEGLCGPSEDREEVTTAP